GVDRTGTHRVIPCLLWLIERMAAAGDEVHVFAAAQEPEPGRWTLLGAQVHNVGRRPVRLRTLRALAAEHRRGRFDVLHAFWIPSGTVAAAARLLLRVPVVLHMPGGDVTRLPEIGYGGVLTWRGRMAVRTAVAAAERVLAPSAYVVAQAAALGIRTERVPFGVALDRWPPAAPRARNPGEPARLLHVGSLNRVKDQGTLLRAAAILRDRGIAFQLDVIGQDTLGGAVQRQAAEMGLDGHVRFHGFLPQAAMRPWVQAAHLLLVTSRHEAGPLVLLEAAVAGVPTVGTAVGHLADWPADACATVPVGDAAALARETARLLADDGARMRMAARAQALALAEDADWTAGRVREIYGEVIEGRSSRRGT
ncbi:MAG TPA: glycosyltransferase family 4 protein, partial [Longimicrobiaceae bacterium]|nr:glycosyltransferase family 4 protein [Longimicrobiaceae bacterium]